MTGKELWLAGVMGDQKIFIRGVFSSEQGAVDVCETTTHFVAPLVVDEVLPIHGAYGYFPCAITNEYAVN